MSEFNFLPQSKGGCAFDGNPSLGVPSAAGTAVFRAALAAVVAKMATLSAVDLATECTALVQCGNHPAGVAAVWTALNFATAGDATSARTALTAAVTVAAAAASPRPVGVTF